MRHLLPRFFCLFLFLASSIMFSQSDSIQSNNDTLSDATFIKKLSEFEKLRFADSIRKADLEAEIVLLKSSDENKRLQLQKQIKALNEKQAQLLVQKKKQIDAVKKRTKGYPVLGFFSDTLFLIHNRLGSFSSKERSEAIT